MERKLFVFVAAAISEVFCKCKPSDVEFANFKDTLKRDHGKLVGVTATRCPGMVDFYFRFELKEIPGSKIVQTSDTGTILVYGYNLDYRTVFKKKYVLTVKVSHYPDMTYSSSETGIIEFIPDKMSIRIVGGTEKTHVVNTTLVVDAFKLSRDPSYGTHERDYEFAENTIKWTITPEIENYTPPEKLKIEVPGHLLKMGTNYTFQVTVTRTKIPKLIDKQVAVQYVEIVSDKNAEINIECIRNCMKPHYLEQTTFAVECTKHCENLNYKWKISPAVDSSQLEFGDGHDKFLVREDSYKAGDVITVTVRSGKSHSSISLQFLSGMQKGECTITPTEGISGVTKFKVKCLGFSSPSGLVLYMIYEKCEGVEGGVLLNEDQFKEETEIYLTEGAPAVIQIKVQDSAYLQETTELSVQVKPFAPKRNISKEEAVKRLVLDKNFYGVSAYSTEGFTSAVVQMVSFLLKAIKDSDLDKSAVRDLHKHIAQGLYQGQLLRFTSSVQLISILTKLQKFKQETDTVTSRYIGKSMVKSALTAYEMYGTNDEYNIPQKLLNKFFNASLSLASEQMKKIEELDSILIEPTPPQDYDSYDEYVSEKLKIRDDLRELVTDSIVSIQINAINSIRKYLPDQKELYFQSEMIHFVTRRVLLTSLMNNQTIGLPEVTKSKIIIPKPLIEELLRESDHVDYQFGVFKKNPFWWHENSSRFNTEFILFDLFHGPYKIKTVENSFYVHLQTETIRRGNLIGVLTDQNIGAHRIEVEPGVTLVAVFESSDETYKVASSDCFCKEEDFSNGLAIKKDTNDSQRTLIARPVKDAKAIYVCIMKSGPKLNYEGNFAIYSCVHWNGRHGKWGSDGCEVQSATLEDGSLVVCKCSHFSLFTGSIFVAPNSLNLNIDVDFIIAFVQNILMVLFVGSLLILWIISLAFAHSKDKAKKKNNVVRKLDDNVPGDSHMYLVVVFTGIFYDAETTADVAFQLIGDQAKSRVHLIRCRDAVLLRRNSQDWFIIFAPFYLGNLRKIRVWHNSKGSKPHWYCTRIIVQYLKNGQQFYFPVNKWFSVVWGDGKTYREIRAKEISQKARKLLFLTQFESEMKDKHLWMSVAVRDAQSNFSSKERISCAFCFVFLSMLANAMFYGVPRNTPADSVDEDSYYFTLFQAVVYIESWLVATPIGMIIVLIFKNSAPRSKSAGVFTKKRLPK